MSLEKEARHHEAIKAQALGEGLQVHRLEKLSRYETHLDRKFERTLGMLVKLKELARGSVRGEISHEIGRKQDASTTGAKPSRAGFSAELRHSGAGT